MAISIETLGAARSYVNETLQGAGALKGQDGESAYQIALDNGFAGSQEEWLASLKGERGDNGLDGLNGKDGADGLDGFSPVIIPDTDNTDEVYKLDITTRDYSFKTENLKGERGLQGIRGEKGEPGAAGQQGIQGIKGEKGDDGYPFLIYKEYESLENFKASDFPQVGLMFMIKTPNEETGNYPVYRYTGEGDTPYSLITTLSDGAAIKGDKGEPGEPGVQGLPGLDGKDGTTYVPTIGTVTGGTDANATVILNEENKEAEFSFVLPKGDKGDVGEKGDKGDKGDTPYIKNGTWWYGNTDSGVPIPSFLDLLKYVDESYGIQDTPIGHIINHMGNNAPKHYLKCDGAIYNIGTYPYLEEHFRKEFGQVDYFGGNEAKGTYAVPDLQGEFLRGTGKLGAEVGDHQEATIHSGIILSNSNNIYCAGNPVTNISNIDSMIVGSSARYTGTQNGNSLTNPNVSGYTSRPTNTSVLYCIKYEPTYFMIINGKE